MPTLGQVRAATGWGLTVSPGLVTTEASTDRELEVLRRPEAGKGRAALPTAPPVITHVRATAAGGGANVRDHQQSFE